jgi:hypothetical protein
VFGTLRSSCEPIQNASEHADSGRSTLGLFVTTNERWWKDLGTKTSPKTSPSLILISFAVAIQSTSHLRACSVRGAQSVNSNCATKTRKPSSLYPYLFSASPCSRCRIHSLPITKAKKFVVFCFESRLQNKHRNTRSVARTSHTRKPKTPTTHSTNKQHDTTKHDCIALLGATRAPIRRRAPQPHRHADWPHTHG